jgi:hypothetical protein
LTKQIILRIAVNRRVPFVDVPFSFQLPDLQTAPRLCNQSFPDIRFAEPSPNLIQEATDLQPSQNMDLGLTPSLEVSIGKMAHHNEEEEEETYKIPDQLQSSAYI